MKEIKDEKNVILLSDCYYHLDEIYDRVKSIMDNLDLICKNKIKVDINAILSDCKYYLNGIYDNADCIMDFLELVSMKENEVTDVNNVEKERLIDMEKIKVEKDVILIDCYYYLKEMWDEIKVMLISLDFSRGREIYDRAKELIDADYLLSVYTRQLEFDIIDFKNGKNIDIDSNIKDYNDACNNVIRKFINNERN